MVRVHTNVVGGAGGFSSALGLLDLDNPEANAASYARWASSVKDFPDVINQKVRTAKTPQLAHTVPDCIGYILCLWSVLSPLHTVNALR